jgi:hypothetical protein
VAKPRDHDHEVKPGSGPARAPDGPDHTIHARLHPTLVRRLVLYCSDSGRPVDDVVREGLERVLPPPERTRLAWEGFQAGVAWALRGVQSAASGSLGDEARSVVALLQHELEATLASFESHRSSKR